MHRAGRVDSVDVSRRVQKQDLSKFNNWFPVPKHHLLKAKTVVQSLQKPAISTYNRYETIRKPRNINE
jgi:hypothetical protein